MIKKVRSKVVPQPCTTPWRCMG